MTVSPEFDSFSISARHTEYSADFNFSPNIPAKIGDSLVVSVHMTDTDYGVESDFKIYSYPVSELDYEELKYENDGDSISSQDEFELSGDYILLQDSTFCCINIGIYNTGGSVTPRDTEVTLRITGLTVKHQDGTEDVYQVQY